MPYDRDLAERVRTVLSVDHGITQQAMFGGLAFLVDAKMAVCVTRGGALMVRVDPSDTDELVTHEHVERFEMRGKPLDGWLYVDAPALAGDDALASWVRRGAGYARGLAAGEAARQ